jgi:hypothetical protein
MPLGDYEAVDPDLAQFDYLPVPKTRWHSIPSDGGGIDRSDSENIGST